MRLELLASAERDLEHLYEYGTDRFGFDAATSYASGLVHSLGLFADQSRMGRERTELPLASDRTPIARMSCSIALTRGRL